MGKVKLKRAGTTIESKKNLPPFGKHNGLVESLELPKDIMYGAVMITAIGRGQVLVENYKGIIEYNTEKIRLQTKNCQVTIEGKRLMVEYYTNEEMKITGFIHGILYD